jgi:DnaK suppressor protein
MKKAKGVVRPVAAPVMSKVPATKSVSKSATAAPAAAVLSAPKKGAKAKAPEVVVKKEKPPFLPPHRPAVVSAPVPTNGKPRKNQAGLLAKELEHYRELLLLKRRELVGDMSSMEREALRSTTGTNLSNLPLHMADMGTDNYEQEFTLGLVEKDRQLLREINTALAKIMDGTYGICEGTGKPISKPRLEAQPWAKFSIEHARAMEKGMLRR